MVLAASYPPLRKTQGRGTRCIETGKRRTKPGPPAHDVKWRKCFPLTIELAWTEWANSTHTPTRRWLLHRHGFRIRRQHHDGLYIIRSAALESTERHAEDRDF